MADTAGQRHALRKVVMADTAGRRHALRVVVMADPGGTLLVVVMADTTGQRHALRGVVMADTAGQRDALSGCYGRHRSHQRMGQMRSMSRRDENLLRRFELRQVSEPHPKSWRCPV